MGARRLGLVDVGTSRAAGHGSRMWSAAAIDIARADLAYLEALLSAAERDDVATALDLPLPRAADVPGMRDEHVSNCRQAGLQLPTP